MTAADILEQVGAHEAIAQHQQANAEAGRKLVLTPASKIRIRPVRWLWDTTPQGAAPTSHGRIPMNSLAIAAGGAGLGKSQCAVWIAAQITRGALPGALYGQPRSVIYAATEDSWSYTIAPRLVAAGADLDRVYRVDVRDDGDRHARLSLPVDIARVGEAVKDYDIALMVADPLLSLIDKSINDYRAAEVRQALEPLVSAADTHRFTILGLAHFTKAGMADPLNRVAGSAAFGQVVRSVIAFAERQTEDGGTERVMSLVKNNLGRTDMPSYTYTTQSVTVDTEEGPSYVSRFVLGEETETTVREVMREEAMPPADREETNRHVLWLRNYLTDRGGCAESAGMKKAARQEGINESALHRARRKLKVAIDRTGFGKQQVSLWSLPNTSADSTRQSPRSHS
jgi:hypothetical protein